MGDKFFGNKSDRSSKKIKRFKANEILTAERLNELIDVIESLEKQVKKLKRSIEKSAS